MFRGEPPQSVMTDSSSSADASQEISKCTDVSAANGGSRSFCKRGKRRGSSHLVVAGLVPAIPVIGHCTFLIEIAGTSPAMTPRVLPLLLHFQISRHKAKGLTNPSA